MLQHDLECRPIAPRLLEGGLAFGELSNTGLGRSACRVALQPGAAELGGQRCGAGADLGKGNPVPDPIGEAKQVFVGPAGLAALEDIGMGCEVTGVVHDAGGKPKLRPAVKPVNRRLNVDVRDFSEIVRGR